MKLPTHFSLLTTNYQLPTTNYPGFTLIELIVVIALFMIIGGSVFATQGRFVSDVYLDTKSREVIQILRLAQVRSMSRFKDSQWGVRVDADAGTNDNFILFKGSSFTARDTAYDLRTDLPDSLSFSNVNLNGGGMDIIFNKVSGNTSQYGSFQISHHQGVSKIITINSLGFIDF